VVGDAPVVRELLGLTGQFAAVDEILTGCENRPVAQQASGPATPSAVGERVPRALTTTATPAVTIGGMDERRMTTFVFRLKAPRPTFALDMTDEEREIMGRHAAHWQPFVDSGQMVVFGPVVDTTGSWGLGVIEAEDEEALRAFAERDPVVVTGTAEIEIGKMLGGFVRPREPGSTGRADHDAPFV